MVNKVLYHLQLQVLAKGSTLKSPLPLKGQGPHLTQCVTGPHTCTCQIALNGLSGMHECDRRQTDRPPYWEMFRKYRDGIATA